MATRSAKSVLLALFLLITGVSSATPLHSQQPGVPAYQAEGWVRTGGPPGGLGYDIRYNFADHNLWYVTDSWAGIHLSNDRGLTWFTSNTGIDAFFGPAGDVIPIFSVTVDPHDPNIVWIGTQHNGGIFKSTDRGYTWQRMDNGVDHDLLPLSFRGFTVDPRSSDIVYAMAEIGSAAWRPDHVQENGLQLDKTMGIVYRTTDGGQNWTEIWRGDNLARYCWINPENPDMIYISTGIFDREAANTDVAAGQPGGVGILKSTDGGQTWRVLNQENGLTDLFVGSLYMNPANPDVLLAAASQDAWSGYFTRQGRGGEFTGGVFLTENGGETWRKVIDNDELFSVVEYCVVDPNIAYAASPQAVYRSDDGGYTWQRFSQPNDLWGPPGIIAGFPIDMQCDPDDPLRIFVNNYLGGNFLSEDGGQTWSNASQGYTGAQMKQLAVLPGQPLTVLAGSRTGLFRGENGGATWIGLSNPVGETTTRLNEVTALAIDPRNSQHLLVGAADSAMVLASDDGGQTWRITEMGGAAGSAAALVFAPSDPTVVYATTPTGLYVSFDSGNFWSPVGEQGQDWFMSALAVNLLDPDGVYVFRREQGLLYSPDGGLTWEARDAGLPDLNVLTITIDPFDPGILFAGLEGGGVYRSTDGGITWTQSAAGLDANAAIGSIVIDPTNTQIVYAADAFSGVHFSTDGGMTWQSLAAAAPWQSIDAGVFHRSAKVLALSDDGTTLYVGIEGDGVYRRGAP